MPGIRIRRYSLENRRLKRKLEKVLPVEESSEESEEVEVIDNEFDVSAEVLRNLVTCAEKACTSADKLDNSLSLPIRKKLRLDRVVTVKRGRKPDLKMKVEEFVNSDLNSVVVHDEKNVKKGLRYRLSSLKVLYEKFLADSTVDCSYSQFTRLIPTNVVKPKAEDWGTCMCMPCMNPEHKLERLKKVMADIQLTISNFMSKTKEDLKEVFAKIKKSEEEFQYLEWIKAKDIGTNITKSAAYHSKKIACVSKPKEFATKLCNELSFLKGHTERMISQYRRIKEIKRIVQDPEQHAKLLRIDWSENVELFQTQQEKSQYYTSVSASVNTGLLYEQDLNLTSLGTISDVKSHQASATMASISEMFRFSDFTNTNKLFILSDSPTSQYRNRKMIFLMKVWATKNHIDVYWIYTESGHGKGPMDGVGAGIKQTIKDTIAYNPKGVITNTDEVMQYMPEMPSVRISTYKEEEVNQFKSLYPKILDNLKIISSGGFGISQVHEIYIPASDKKNSRMEEDVI